MRQGRQPFLFVTEAVTRPTPSPPTMCSPPPLLVREFAHMATVVAASQCKDVVLTGSCALNVYLPLEYAFDVGDIDLFLHYELDDDTHREQLLHDFVGNLDRQYKAILASHKYAHAAVAIRVSNFWHSGAMTYQLSYGPVHFADVTAVPYSRIGSLFSRFPRTVVDVTLPNDEMGPPMTLAIASLEELLHRIVCTLRCSKTLDGFTGISASVNAWRIAKDGKRLRRFYDLYKRRLVSGTPRTWTMDTCTPFAHGVPIDDDGLLPLFGRTTHGAVHASFVDAFSDMSEIFAGIHRRLDGMTDRIQSCTVNSNFVEQHVAARQRSRRRLDDTLLRTRSRLKQVNDDAKGVCKEASETIDSLRMMVLLTQKDADKAYSQLSTHVAALHETVVAAVQCTGTELTLTSFAANFTSVSEAVAEADLLPFSLFSGRTCGLPAPIPIDSTEGLARANAYAASAASGTHADALRQLFARSMLATFMVTLEMLSRSRRPCGPAAAAEGPRVVIEPGWKDTGDMLSELARNIRVMKLGSTRRVVPLISKTGQLSVRVLEEMVADDDDFKSSSCIDFDALALPLANTEKDAVFAMCDSFITVLTTPLLAHACAIGAAVRTIAGSTHCIREAFTQLKKPNSSLTYQRLAASNTTATKLRKLATTGFVQ